jgi:asparagine synthase (glutamine-hydrolysing)
MCGIFGQVGQPLPQKEALQQALSALRHRGPDGQGLSQPDEGVVLGHTRLKVIDLSAAAAQPMQTPDGQVVVTFNGEIYNHRELREHLAARGHVFRTRCDTEVLLYGYREWGDDLPLHLDGMFAFGLWDRQKQRLLLCRDRAGEKPLYYHFDAAEQVLRFASEIKALMPLGTPLAVHHAELPTLLSFGYVPAPATLYAGVEQLPPGCLLVYPAAGPTRSRPQVRRYFLAPFGRAPRATLLPAALGEVRHLFREAVRTRLQSDVPLGAFLSGGIDSSLVVGVLARGLGRSVKTFSLGFAGDPRFDETRYARAVAAAFQTDHTEFVVTPGTFDLPQLTEELVHLHDGPFGDSSAIPTYLVAKLARQHVTVALTGDGGDELFCGYERLLAAEVAELLPGPLLGLLRRLLSRLPSGAAISERALPARALRFLAAATLPLPERVARWNSLFLAELPRLLRPDWLAALDPGRPLAFQRAIFSGASGTPLSRVLHHNFVTYLPYDLLIKVDRTAMAHSLETRAPFLAPRLIEYAAALPDGYRRRGLCLKWILKEAFADLLPEIVRRRGKMGFGIPLATWFRGELKDFLLQHLASGARLYDLLSEDVVRAHLDQHLSGRADHSQRLFLLLTLEVWLRNLPRWRAHA